MPRMVLLSRPTRRLLLLPLLLVAAGLIAAACSDDDFHGAPDDRGAAAAALVGATEREPVAEQAAEEPAVIEGSEDAQSDTPPAVAAEDESQPADAGEEEQPAPVTLGDAARGQELFFANGCNICHGDQGQGGIGPTIAVTRLSLDQVIAQYRSPRAAMPSFPADRVPDAAVADIYAWLQTLDLPDTIVPGEGTP